MGWLSWLICPYVLMSLLVGGLEAIRVGLDPGLCALLTSALVLIAAVGLKANLFWGNMRQKIGGTVVTVSLTALAFALSRGFSVHLLDHTLSGTAWGAIGFAICFLFAGRRLTDLVTSR
jgi:hypothetical protein